MIESKFFQRKPKPPMLVTEVKVDSLVQSHANFSSVMKRAHQVLKEIKKA